MLKAVAFLREKCYNTHVGSAAADPAGLSARTERQERVKIYVFLRSGSIFAVLQ